MQPDSHHKKAKILINFVDFWHEPTDEMIRKNPIYYLLKKRWDLVLSDNPDYLIYSNSGFEYKRFQCLRIFYTGENIRPNFNECDYAFSFDYPITKRNYRLPLYRFYSSYRKLFEPRVPKQIISQKRKFCCFLVSNPKAKERIKFFDLLNSYKHVDSGGLVRNNIGYRVSRDNTEDWLSGYKFSIVFENESYPGYTTEKLQNALVTNTIPIYWGNPLIAKDYNPKAFINCHDFSSFSEVVKQVEKIDNDPSLYFQYLNEPFVSDMKENSFCNIDNILNRFDNIFRENKCFISPVKKKFHKFQYYPEKSIRYIFKKIKNTFLKMRNFQLSS